MKPANYAPEKMEEVLLRHMPAYRSNSWSEIFSRELK